MQKIHFVVLLLMIFTASCSNEKKYHYTAKNYWNERISGNKSTLESFIKVYSQGSDSIFHCTFYYPNGKIKSKVVHQNDRLMEILFVHDTNGNTLPFGKLSNRNGTVIQYDNETGVPKYKGKYKSGNKEGWWITYHFKGEILDSTFYQNGFPQQPKSTDALNQLIDAFGPMKNNWYR